MTSDLDFAGFTDELGERRRRAEMMTSPLLTDTLTELGRAEEELRTQNEALFAARTALEEEQQVFRDLFDLSPTASLVTTARGGRRGRPHVALGRDRRTLAL